MFKIILILLLIIPLPALAVEAGDPDSDSAPLLLEPEANLPPPSDDNPDEHADDADELEAKGSIPGAHMVPPLTGENQPAEDDKWHEMKFARLQGLNKVTAKSSEIKADIGAKTKFGNLEFVVEKCLRGPETQKYENTALFTIWDEIPGQEKKEAFRGWMFSSSPAISALEHPIYDIILLGCGEAPKTTMPEAKKADAKKEKKPKAVKP